MQKRTSKRGIGLCCLMSLALTLLLPGVAGGFRAAADTPADRTFTGYVIDEDCLAYGPATHGRMCLSMPKCAASGYGIAIPQSDGSFRFAFFDGTVATASSDKKSFVAPYATGGQKAAYDLIAASAKSRGIAVTVTGHLTGRSQTSPDGDEVAYPQLAVISIAEYAGAPAATDGANASLPGANVPAGHPAAWSGSVTLQQTTLKGYIIDEDCFDPTSDPGAESRKCLLMKGCASSGYGIAVKQGDGKYLFYYFDGTIPVASGMDFAPPPAAGTQKAAYDLIAAANKSNHIYITVTGALRGDRLTAADGRSYAVLTADPATLKEEAAPAAARTTSSSKAAASDNPKTGDGSGTVAWAVLLSGAAGLLTWSGFRCRRKA